MAQWYSLCELSRIWILLITFIYPVVVHSPFVDAFIKVIDQNSSVRRCVSSGPSTGSLWVSSKTTQWKNQDGCNSSAINYRLFTHDGWTCAYRYKAAQSSECQRRYQPLLLIHPVGIGLSSWFWSNLMQQYQGEVYAIDLIGCGTIGGDMWDPQIRGMFFPRTWSEQCLSLLLQRGDIRRPCAVVCQGAVAPVGVLLTHFYPHYVSHLILTSPPEFNDMIQPIPTSSLERNYRFYQSPVWGSLAFSALENRRAIQLFSNLFLFESPITAHDIFVTKAIEECKDSNYLLLRNPIKAFNAGLLLHRSLKVELESIRQPTLILCGESDKLRNNNRQGYQEIMNDCTLKVIPGKNILPWEFPEEVCNEIIQFTQTSRKA
jgi:pimeloyl-ACP methyl ester carboxylesterase